MILESLHLLQFKNYFEANFDFVPGINCFSGNNGAGKTNILDAVYYLSFCKSFSNVSDTQNIKLDSDFFLIQGQYQSGGNRDDLYCGVKRAHKKVFKRNKKEYDRLSDHIGLYPLVLIYPGDVQLITEGSDERRKFIDGVISQYRKEYLYRLIDYNKALAQRNSLLKIFAEKKYFDDVSLEIWDEQLVSHGNYIYEARLEFFRDFSDVFRQHYRKLGNNSEDVDIIYESGLHDESLAELLKASRKRDMMLQYTTAGIHKDNLGFMLNNQPLKRFGSQGQQKTYVIALKLAQYEFIREIKGFEPILLFDDIFDKLDPLRVEQLVKLVSGSGFGQIFITDTHSGRLVEILEQLQAHSRIFQVSNGEVVSVTDYGK
jgi:DNA replication and repair protein RecF